MSDVRKGCEDDGLLGLIAFSFFSLIFDKREKDKFDN